MSQSSSTGSLALLTEATEQKTASEAWMANFLLKVGQSAAEQTELALNA